MFMLQMYCYYVTFVCTIFWEGVICWISCYFLIIFLHFWVTLYCFFSLAISSSLLVFLAVFIFMHIHFFTFLFLFFIYYSFCVIFSIICYCLTWNNSFIWCVAYFFWCLHFIEALTWNICVQNFLICY